MARKMCAGRRVTHFQWWRQDPILGETWSCPWEIRCTRHQQAEGPLLAWIAGAILRVLCLVLAEARTRWLHPSQRVGTCGGGKGVFKQQQQQRESHS
jgi:hypothetical protein